MALEHEALTERIIGAAIEVDRRLGPSVIESVYEKALIIELKKRGLAVRDQMKEVIVYDGEEVSSHRLDLFCGGSDCRGLHGDQEPGRDPLCGRSLPTERAG
jgi:hypothetical protein